MQKYYKKWFWFFTSPALIFFVLVVIIPFLTGVLYSFTNWRNTYFYANGNGTVDGYKTDKWYEAFIGFKNYIKAFNSEEFGSALVYTFAFTFVAVLLINTVSLLLAVLLTNIRTGKGPLRAIFFMPNLLSGLALGFIWQFIFEYVFTKILFGKNSILHIEFFCNMTHDRWKALFALVFMATWQMAGYMMIIYINGLNNIPTELYEAADMDGANVWQKFKIVTMPLLMPSITIVFFLTLANSFKLFDQNVALTNGTFNTRMIALNIVQETSDRADLGYGIAQAEAIIFFVIVAIITLLQVSFTKKREVEA